MSQKTALFYKNIIRNAKLRKLIDRELVVNYGSHEVPSRNLHIFGTICITNNIRLVSCAVSGPLGFFWPPAMIIQWSKGGPLETCFFMSSILKMDWTIRSGMIWGWKKWYGLSKLDKPFSLFLHFSVKMLQIPPFWKWRHFLLLEYFSMRFSLPGSPQWVFSKKYIGLLALDVLLLRYQLLKIRKMCNFCWVSTFFNI